MSAASGDIWLFFDDDVELEPEFIEELVGAYSADTAGVAGIMTNYRKYPLGRRLWERIFARGIFHDPRQELYWNADRLRNSQPIGVDRFTGAAMSFRASVLRELRWDTQM